ncbi:hypothetical protein MRX96_023688 [Rhipicephalus microplus]
MAGRGVGTLGSRGDVCRCLNATFLQRWLVGILVLSDLGCWLGGSHRHHGVRGRVAGRFWDATARDTVALAVSATTSPDVSASSSPQLLVSSSTVPPAAPPPATGASNGLPGASPHSTRTYPASSRPHSASPPLSLSLFRGLRRAPAPCLRGARACPHRRRRHRQPPKQLPPSPLCLWRRSRHLRRDPASHRWFRPAPVLVPLVPPGSSSRKQPQILPKLSSGSANMTTPSAAATTRSQSPGGPAQGHTVARACTSAAACDHGAARSRDGAQHRESAAHREPRGSAAGHVSGWTCVGHFPAEPVHSGPGPQPDYDARRIGADPELSGTDTGGPAGPAATPCHGPDPGTSDGAQAPWGTSRTAWHPDACHPTDPGAKAQHLSGTATHDVAPPRLP